MLLLDGNVSANNGAASATLTLPALTTTGLNRVILVGIQFAAAGGDVGVSSVSDAASQNVLTFTEVPGAHNFGSSIRTVTIFKAIASVTLSSDVITVTVGGAPEFVYGANAIAISGADTSSTLDPNASLPAKDGALFSTSNANDFIYMMAQVESGTVNPDTGYTLAVAGAGGTASEYIVVSSTQSGVGLNFAGSVTVDKSVAIAVKAASASASSGLGIQGLASSEYHHRPFVGWDAARDHRRREWRQERGVLVPR
jgi:hypothetical protein